ncbi:MAG: undecaprenyl-diphosphatase, partial [Gammaproteobacteria bacterium]
MDLSHIVALALLQGITEFLPISSSAHLILVPSLLGWTDQGLDFDIAVHGGTLLAVIAYFRREVAALVADGLASLSRGTMVGEGRLFWAVILGTVPVGLAGLAFKNEVETHLRSAAVIAWATLGFGLLLGLADALGRKVRDEHTLTLRDAVIIGLFQALALI